jgi:hypothetical protein
MSLTSNYYGGLNIVLTINIWINSPRDLRSQSLITVFGGIILVFRGLFYYNINLFAPWINLILFVIGISLHIYVFIRMPQVAFVLANKVIIIFVIDAASGLPVFEYNWIENEKDIYSEIAKTSGTMFGINVILKDLLRGGNIHEICLDRATLLLQRSLDEKWLFALVVKKPMKLIRSALDHFCQQFTHLFEHLPVENRTVDAFAPAQTLLVACFPFVPNITSNKKSEKENVG